MILDCDIALSYYRLVLCMLQSLVKSLDQFSTVLHVLHLFLMVDSFITSSHFFIGHLEVFYNTLIKVISCLYQEELLDETKRMVPDCERRLRSAWEELSKIVVNVIKGIYFSQLTRSLESVCYWPQFVQFSTLNSLALDWKLSSNYIMSCFFQKTVAV